MSACRNPRSWAAGWVRHRRSDDFARLRADALRQLSGVQAHRQAYCDDSVPRYRHGCIIQYGAGPTRIAAAGMRAVTAESSDGSLAALTDWRSFALGCGARLGWLVQPPKTVTNQRPSSRLGPPGLPRPRLTLTPSRQCKDARHGRAGPRHCTAKGFMAPLGYRRHRPETTLLYRIVAEHHPRFRDRRIAEGRPLPRYVEDEFDAYLKCGLLEHGFLRVKCESCQAEKLVAFSCIGRFVALRRCRALPPPSVSSGATVLGSTASGSTDSIGCVSFGGPATPTRSRSSITTEEDESWQSGRPSIRAKF